MEKHPAILKLDELIEEMDKLEFNNYKLFDYFIKLYRELEFLIELEEKCLEINDLSKDSSRNNAIMKLIIEISQNEINPKIIKNICEYFKEENE